MTIAETRALPPVISVTRAGELLGWGKTQAHIHATRRLRDGAGPWPAEVEVIEAEGCDRRVRTADVLRYLGIEPAGVSS